MLSASLGEKFLDSRKVIEIHYFRASYRVWLDIANDLIGQNRFGGISESERVKLRCS